MDTPIVPIVVPCTQEGIDAIKAAGINHPDTVPALEWMHRHRKTNGFADAFALVNGRRLFKPRVYLEIVERMVG